MRGRADPGYSPALTYRATAASVRSIETPADPSEIRLSHQEIDVVLRATFETAVLWRGVARSGQPRRLPR